MPRFYCDYCDIYLNFDSYHGRKQHQRGRKHQDNVRQYYMQFLQRSGIFNRARSRGIPLSGCLIPIPRGRGLVPFNHMLFRRGIITMPQNATTTQTQLHQHPDISSKIQQCQKISTQIHQPIPINLTHSRQSILTRNNQRQFLDIQQPFISHKFS